MGKYVSNILALIKAEFIKLNFGKLAIFISGLTFIYIGCILGICEMSVDYTDLSLDTYFCVVLFEVSIILVLPVLVWGTNIYISNLERKNKGWMLSYSLVENRKEIILAKHLINVFFIMLIYCICGIFASVIMYNRGISVVYEVIIVPIILSCISIIPISLFIQYFSMIFENPVILCFSCIFYIILTYVLTQTQYKDYFCITYPYSLLLGTEQIVVKLVACVIIEIILIIGVDIPVSNISKKI